MIKTNKQIAPITLENYDPLWQKMFSQEKKKLLAMLGNNVKIEHIGSTTIPGIVAKPEIDILIGINSLDEAQKYIKPLKSLGYPYYPRLEEAVPERRYFRKSKGIIPLFHIHMVEKKNEFWRDHILFRDHLLKNPKVAKEYSDLKKNLAKKYHSDRKTYSKEKSKFIESTLGKIKAE